ncbi:MAG: enoyl-[acyl-carrier protein] reductase II [Glaciecola sp.]|jgi:enoyl-[acyl-carrier protein] reductase II
MDKNNLCKLLKIKHPIIQGGMVWCSGWKLASAVSNNGGLGVLGAGSMNPDLLEEHILKTKANTNMPFGVNIPLFSKYSEQQIEKTLQHKVPVAITSAGNPNKYSSVIKSEGVTVLHVVANSKFTQKAIDANVDGIIGEGFEAGGHNGKDETTTLCLIPQLRKITDKPLVAAGGIGNGQSMFATMALGADGVQIGSRFAVSMESSAHDLFKKAVVNAVDGDTKLTLKELTPVRMLKSDFFKKVMNAYSRNATIEELKLLLGSGRTKKGIFEGDLKNGELEIGQVSGYLDKIETVEDIMISMISEFQKTKIRMSNY